MRCSRSRAAPGAHGVRRTGDAHAGTLRALEFSGESWSASPLGGSVPCLSTGAAGSRASACRPACAHPQRRLVGVGDTMWRLTPVPAAPTRARTERRPRGAIAVGDLPHRGRRPVGHDAHAVLGAPVGALHRAQAVPQRRRGLWHARHLDRTSLKADSARRRSRRAPASAPASAPRRPRGRMPAPWRGLHAVVAISNGDTPRPMPSSSRPPLIWSSMQTSSITRSGVVHAQRVHQRPEAQPLGALRHRREEHLGDGR